MGHVRGISRKPKDSRGKHADTAAAWRTLYAGTALGTLTNWNPISGQRVNGFASVSPAQIGLSQGTAAFAGINFGSLEGLGCSVTAILPYGGIGFLLDANRNLPGLSLSAPGKWGVSGAPQLPVIRSLRVPQIQIERARKVKVIAVAVLFIGFITSAMIASSHFVELRDIWLRENPERKFGWTGIFSPSSANYFDFLSGGVSNEWKYHKKMYFRFGSLSVRIILLGWIAIFFDYL